MLHVDDAAFASQLAQLQEAIETAAGATEEGGGGAPREGAPPPDAGPSELAAGLVSRRPARLLGAEQGGSQVYRVASEWKLQQQLARLLLAETVPGGAQVQESSDTSDGVGVAHPGEGVPVAYPRGLTQIRPIGPRLLSS